MQSVMLKTALGTAWLHQCIVSMHFPHLDHFPETFESFEGSQKDVFFFVFVFFPPAAVSLLSENRAAVSDHVPVEEAHQSHLISAEPGAAEQ